MLSVDRFDSEQHVKLVTCPYLHLHGQKDTVVPISLGNKLFAAAPEKSSRGIPKQLVILPNANHNDVYETDQQQALGAIRDFLSKVMPQ